MLPSVAAMNEHDLASAAQRCTTHGFYPVVRAPRRTCRWCAEPTLGLWACRHCTDHHRVVGAAEVIVPLAYAIAGTQASKMLRDYKDHSSRLRRAECATVLTMLLRSTLSTHERCVEAAVGLPIGVRTVIPSLTWRPGAHPFTAVARDTGMAVDELLTGAVSATCHRVVDPTKFVVLDVDAVASRHVLVLDDIWTTGSNAQSAALALRTAGAAAVSVVVVGRWLNPDYPPTKAFMDRYPFSNIGFGSCPVSGDECPPTGSPTPGGHRPQ